MREAADQHRRLRLILVGAQVLCVAATAGTMVALPWLILQGGGSFGGVGVVLAVRVLPLVLLGPWVCAQLITRLGDLRTLIVCDLARAALLACVPLAASHGLGLLCIVVAPAALLASPHYVGQRTIVARIAGDEARLLKVTSELVGATHLGAVVGPAVAAALLVAAGPEWVLYAAGGALVVAAGLAATLRSIAPDATTRAAQPKRRARTGWSLLRRTGAARRALLTTTLLDASIIGLTVVGTTAVASQYDLGPGVAGMAVAAAGAGAVLATIGLSRYAQRISSIRWYPWLAAAATAPVFVLCLTHPTPASLIAVLAIAGVFNAAAASTCMAVITTRTPAHEQPDAFALVMSLNTAAIAGSYLLGGIVADAFGSQALMWGIAATSVVFVCSALRQRGAGEAERAAVEPVSQAA